jgi:hypothetical protein
MSRMTLKEKMGQLNLPCVDVDELGRDIPSKLEVFGSANESTVRGLVNTVRPSTIFFSAFIIRTLNSAQLFWNQCGKNCPTRRQLLPRHSTRLVRLLTGGEPGRFVRDPDEHSVG